MKLTYQDYYDYLAEHVIVPFYEKRLNKLRLLKLKDVLRRKNPYLFKAKNIELPHDLMKGVVDAHLSSQEETMFGNLLEGFAIYISGHLYGGFKSKRKSIDLEFQHAGKYYIVGIKSSTNWGNSDQIGALKESFRQARIALRAEGITQEIIAVNGCIYGKDRNPLKNTVWRKGQGRIAVESDKVYYKYGGQDFWFFISGDDNLYREIIAPIDAEARQKDEVLKETYTAKVNEMTLEFMQNFMLEHRIDWLKLIDYVSQRKGKRPISLISGEERTEIA